MMLNGQTQLPTPYFMATIDAQLLSLALMILVDHDTAVQGSIESATQASKANKAPGDAAITGVGTLAAAVLR